MKRTEKGFSLIELSIVLIIIGLLVAGITGGASLVRSATVRAVMSEANSFNAAVNAYYARFSNLPGDDTKGGPTDGDGNGRIEYFNANGISEGTLAWKHLSDADIVEGGFDAVVGTGVPAVNTNMPASKLASASWVMDFDSTQGLNTLVLGNPQAESTAPTAVTKVTSNSVINGESAKSIDTKMDDGAQTTGKIIGYSGGSDTCNYTGTTPTCYMGFATAL